MEVSISNFLPSGLFNLFPVINKTDYLITKFVLHNSGYKKDIFFSFPTVTSIRSIITKFLHLILASLLLNKTLTHISYLYSRLQFSQNNFGGSSSKRKTGLLLHGRQTIKANIEINYLFFPMDICQSKMK